MNVDVFVDDDRALEAIRAECGQRGVDALPFHLLANLHVDEIPRAARRHVDGAHAGRQLLQLRVDHALHAEREQRHVLGTDVEDIVKDRIPAMRDGGDVEDPRLPRR